MACVRPDMAFAVDCAFTIKNRSSTMLTKKQPSHFKLTCWFYNTDVKSSPKSRFKLTCTTLLVVKRGCKIKSEIAKLRIVIVFSKIKQALRCNLVWWCPRRLNKFSKITLHWITRHKSCVHWLPITVKQRRRWLGPRVTGQMWQFVCDAAQLSFGRNLTLTESCKPSRLVSGRRNTTIS